VSEQEAIEVARIVSMADGGCPSCVSDLIKELQKSFPEVDWLVLAKRFWNGEIA
jgi:hypothetical protein